MIRTRAERRHSEWVAKSRARRLLKARAQHWGEPIETVVTPAAIGHMAATHCRPCSCSMCSSRHRKWGADPARQEYRDILESQDQVRELMLG